jgi:hypothetical protein
MHSVSAAAVAVARVVKNIEICKNVAHRWSAELIIDKSIANFRRWHHARVVPTEPTIAIARQDTVRAIADRAGQEPKNAKHAPSAPQMLSYFQRCFGLGECLTIGNKYEGFGVLGINSKFLHKPRTGRGLKGCESNNVIRLVPQNKLH